jgi:hypothetical protein
VLFRLVDIGAELFAMAAVISRARAEAASGNAGATELADIFCRHARRRVGDLFRGIYGPDDVATYRAAQHVVAGEHAWLERGIVTPR